MFIYLKMHKCLYQNRHRIYMIRLIFNVGLHCIMFSSLYQYYILFHRLYRKEISVRKLYKSN